MTKKKVANTKVADIIGFIIALMYVQSVLTVAHHTSMWVRDGTAYTVGPPAIPALLLGLAVVVYSSYRNKLALTTVSIVTLTILATASIFWLSGLRTNFYF